MQVLSKVVDNSYEYINKNTYILLKFISMTFNLKCVNTNSDESLYKCIYNGFSESKYNDCDYKQYNLGIESLKVYFNKNSKEIGFKYDDFDLLFDLSLVCDKLNDIDANTLCVIYSKAVTFILYQMNITVTKNMSIKYPDSNISNYGISNYNKFLSIPDMVLFWLNTSNNFNTISYTNENHTDKDYEVYNVCKNLFIAEQFDGSFLVNSFTQFKHINGVSLEHILKLNNNMFKNKM